MSRFAGAIDRATVYIAENVPGGIVMAIALLGYLGGGLALPLALNWSAPYLVDANVFGVAFAAMLTLGWMEVQIKARDRRHLMEWTTSLHLLKADEFEWLVGELFRREGWTVKETGRQSGPDGGVDLELAKGGQRTLVQCKRWTSNQVGVVDVRAFAGVLAAVEPRPAGLFVTLSDFTPQAREAAQTTRMTLLDGRDLYLRIERVRRREPCPDCGAFMHLGQSEYGWWFRCTVGGCSGKRDLGRDPGRAVELLTRAT